MKIQQPLHLALFLLCCFLSGSTANRVYVHPFSLFAAENVSCETLHPLIPKPHRTLPVAPLDIEVLMPDSRDPLRVDAQKQNITERTAVLAGLSNLLGLRMYLALSRMQQSNNTLLSPFSSFGSLMTFYLGASKTTARMIQLFLGLSSGTDPEDCVSLVDGHKVLKTLQSINSLVDDGPKDEITTHVWTFSRQDAELSEDFVQGTQDFSDSSFIRGIDFSKPQEAEQAVNSFVEKTSGGKVASIFNNLNPSNDLLFLTSFKFQGNWRTAFQPERTSMQEFHVDETTTVTAPFMTHTGRYHYLNDKVNRCTVVKLSLSRRSHMLIVLPHEGSNLHNIESKLLTDVMSDWYERLHEGLLELTLPKFSMSSVTDMHDLLTNMDPIIESSLLGSQAEFSRLSNSKPFTIDKVINKVMFEMSEDGEPQDRIQEEGIPLGLSINRPFFFSVFEENSNAILMLGKINNPTL
ncbi:angiotensinogen [Cheilinus undulatus]|uniref:angiotensinogen n=1 Tax=Cheilinus undulatus TaxID=241271 RepID=UPI001BD568B9|nr:angiotensinogen [Cheilinus undulatus]